MVGVRGFEPPASASRTQRSSQTEPHPDLCRRLSNIYSVLIFASGFRLFFAFYAVFCFRSCIKNVRSPFDGGADAIPKGVFQPKNFVPILSIVPSWNTMNALIYASVNKAPASMNAIFQEFSSRLMIASVARQGIDSRQKSIIQNA